MFKLRIKVLSVGRASEHRADLPYTLSRTVYWPVVPRKGECVWIDAEEYRISGVEHDFTEESVQIRIYTTQKEIGYLFLSGDWVDDDPRIDPSTGDRISYTGLKALEESLISS